MGVPREHGFISHCAMLLQQPHCRHTAIMAAATAREHVVAVATYPVAEHSQEISDLLIRQQLNKPISHKQIEAHPVASVPGSKCATQISE